MSTRAKTNGEATTAKKQRTDDDGAAAGAGNNFVSSRARGKGSSSGFPERREERVDRLVGYERNARTHTPESVDRLVKLIQEYGWTNPILVAGVDILAGHRRLAAAKKLGLEVVPVVDLRHLSDTQRRAYILADNQSALDAGWDQDMLVGELSDLQELGVDLALTGFFGLELQGLLGAGTQGLTDPDAVPPVEEAVVSRVGDVWLLGARVRCPRCQTVQAVRKAEA